MARPAGLFPDRPERRDADIERADLAGHHRVAERHGRQLARLSNSRQLLFAPAIAIVSFERRREQDREGREVELLYAIQDLYTTQRDPEHLTAPPPPLAYTRHEAPLRDLKGAPPAIPEPARREEG